MDSLLQKINRGRKYSSARFIVNEASERLWQIKQNFGLEYSQNTLTLLIATKDSSLNQTVSKYHVPRLGHCLTEIHRNTIQSSLHTISRAIPGFYNDREDSV